MKRLSPLLLLCALSPATAGAGDYVDVPGGDFRSAVRYEEGSAPLPVAGFALMARPVGNAAFAAFVERHPQWRRDRLPAVFSSPGYLGHWESPQSPGAGVDPDAPVVHVNWYAANAYCRAQQARLPTFLEWEYVAAADARRHDARGDAQWLARHLYDGTPRALDAAPDAPANAYGVYGMHGAVWEWSEDHASLLGAGDRRGQEDGDRLKYCGASALAFNDRGHYGVQKRFALLTALRSGDALGNLGFRCARSLP